MPQGTLSISPQQLTHIFKVSMRDRSKRQGRYGLQGMTGTAGGNYTLSAIPLPR